MLRKKGQTSIEYAVVLIIVIGVFLSMQSYVKRAFQGRWKAAVDDLGDQYDANAFTSHMHYTLNTESTSTLSVVFDPQAGVNGYSTYRNDTSFSVEQRTGSSNVAPAGL